MSALLRQSAYPGRPLCEETAVTLKPPSCTGTESDTGAGRHSFRGGKRTRPLRENLLPPLLCQGRAKVHGSSEWVCALVSIGLPSHGFSWVP